MDADGVDEASNPKDDIQAVELEAESSKMESIEVMSSGGDTIQELENAWEVLTRAELDLACHSDKLLNLEILVMHVASRESDFEAFVSEKEATFGDSTNKAFEFDLLSGVLESELNEEEKFLVSIQSEIDSTSNNISSYKCKEDFFGEIQEKLQDCGKSLKQSFEQVSEMRLQSDNFKRILSSFSGGKKKIYLETSPCFRKIEKNFSAKKPLFIGAGSSLYSTFFFLKKKKAGIDFNSLLLPLVDLH